MKRDMKAWLREMRRSPVKKALPVLSFPAVQLMGISVGELISSGDRQVEGMKRVAGRIDSAAAVSLMDLSVEAECFGSRIVVSDVEVPTVVGSVVNTPEEARALRVPEAGAGRTALYIEAIRRAAEEIADRPTLAGVIGPFSLAARLLDVSEAMILCYEEPEMVHEVLEKATRFILNYILAYREAGANGVIMAEPVAGLLSPDLTAEFSAPYVKKIVDEVQTDDFIVVYHNCGNCTIRQIDSILSTGSAAYHFGNAIDMEEMMGHIPADIIAMGNVDPAAEFRNGSPESVRAATLSVMERCSRYPNFVISSGCDIPPMSPWENIDAFFAAVKEFYAKERSVS